MKDLHKKLNKLSSGKKSKWTDEAEYRLKNKKWLRYSSNIARRLLAILEDRKEMNQKILAHQVGVTPQYISKVLKGHENLSLETIGKLSDAIGFELITFQEYKYSRPSVSDIQNQFESIYFTENKIQAKVVSIYSIDKAQLNNKPS